MSLDLSPYIVHEADLAVYYAWQDGFPMVGPGDRNLESGVVLAYRSGLTIRQAPESTVPTSFGDWRQASRNSGSLWEIETNAPLSAITEFDSPVSSFVAPGAKLIIVIRFLCQNTHQWRVFQFHDAEVDSTSSTDSNQIMMTGYRFKAGWMEEFSGTTGTTLPDMNPVLCGTVEWCHGERRIPCQRYDAVANTWTETAQNTFLDTDGNTSRYVTIDNTSGVTSVSYLAALTRIESAAIAGGLSPAVVGWIDALAFTLSSSGLTLQPGWQRQDGAPEPLTIPPSGRHWDHPTIRFRFLGRIYATIGYGIVAFPRYVENAIPDRPLDYPIRLDRLVLLPDAAYLLPA